MTEEQKLKADFEALARPLVKWMAENCHPHTTTIIDATSAELLEGSIAFTTTEYLRD